MENGGSGLNVGKEVRYAVYGTTLPVFDKGGSAGDVENVENLGSEKEQIFYWEERERTRERRMKKRLCALEPPKAVGES